MASELTYRGHDDAHHPESVTASGYTPKPTKPHIFFSRPLRHLLSERLLFVLVGVALASLLFYLVPPSSSSSAASAVVAKLALSSAVRPARFGVHPHRRGAFETTARRFVGGKVPLGIRRKGLRILVTGGAGFVGSHLVDRLMARGDSVIVVDNFFTGRKENVIHHFGNPNFELIRHDVVEPLLVEVDQIYHLACPASPVHYKFNPIKTIISFSAFSLFVLIIFLLMPSSYCLWWGEVSIVLLFVAAATAKNQIEQGGGLLSSFFGLFKALIHVAFCCGLHKTNVVGTLNMLGLAKRVGARFLLTSTSEVYGDPMQHPQVETYWGNVNPIGVRSCYDEGKRTAETLTMDYHRGAQVEVRIARIFNTYGPRMCIDDGRVVSNFVAQALRKEPLTVYGDGKQTRSFQYVSDLVEGLMRLMEGEHVGPFNLGNPGEFTMLELAQVVQETIDSNAKIEFRPNTEDDPHKRKPDITRAKELLGWQPKISLREGLSRMVSDFRKRIFGDQFVTKPSTITTSTASGTGSS
ncbi:hypothetical protein Cni_G09150 [Canna indica]|uniref:UDP-glucuronate decarboxylase n=1 Tax=Canna indica TaxID=4628 RepID=A0AAQ3K558_9LILI|nr:hypothetical protein Cni_G09150 [Canna indica]